MNNTQHTPGPWKVESIFPDPARGHTFEPVIYITAHAPEYDADVRIVDIKFDNVRIADLPDAYVDGLPIEEQVANARLIAAAPDMFDFILQIAASKNHCTCEKLSWTEEGHSAKCVHDIAGAIIQGITNTQLTLDAEPSPR